MADRTMGWFRAACAGVLLFGCARPASRETQRESSAKTSAIPAGASAVPAQAAAIPLEPADVRARLGIGKEVDTLIALSRTELSPEEKRAHLLVALEKFPEHSKEREDLIVLAVAGGAVDPPTWTTIVSNYQGRRAEIEVTTDALTILGVRFDVTAEGAQRIADRLHAILPTPRILQLIWEQADVRLTPCTLPSDAEMASTARMIEHSKCVDQRIAGRKGLIVNVGKHWVLTNRISEKRNLAANYGWFMKGRRPIQTVGTRHDTAHTDYSQVLRLVKPSMRVDGREVDIRQVGRSPELWGLVSDEGPLLVWRASRPGASPSPNDNPVAAAPPPAPGDPKSVRLTLKLDEFPVGVEQLPSTTTGLRRSTFERRLLRSLRLRPDDVPEEAYWSYGAATCGGRDIFFELMNQVGVDFEELERTRDSIKQSLACGKAMAPHIHAGAGVYQIEYDYQSAPSGLAFFTLPADSLRDQLVYPRLSPTPVGVHRAFCNDDEGGPRSVCQDGERSRLILAVNNGYVAAYAREVPSLLETLTKSQAPSPKVAALAALFLEPTPAEEVAIAEGGSCAFALDFTAWALSADETSRQRVLDAANDDAVFCGTQAWGTIVSLNRRLVFVAKDEESAQALAAALKRRNAEASRQAFTSLAHREVQVEFDQARRSAEARALRSAKLETQGLRVAMTLTVEPNEAEFHDMSPLLDERRATAQRAAAIVRNLAEGTLPTAAELATYLPPSASKAMATFTPPSE
jgi:hypothetical protein